MLVLPTPVWPCPRLCQRGELESESRSNWKLRRGFSTAGPQAGLNMGHLADTPMFYCNTCGGSNKSHQIRVKQMSCQMLPDSIRMIQVKHTPSHQNNWLRLLARFDIYAIEASPCYPLSWNRHAAFDTYITYVITSYYMDWIQTVAWNCHEFVSLSQYPTSPSSP